MLKIGLKFERQSELKFDRKIKELEVDLQRKFDLNILLSTTSPL